MWLFAKPMIWLNFLTGSPSRIGSIAILWPLWMRWRAVRPWAGSPWFTRSIAMTTLSSPLRRITRGVFMLVFLYAGAVIPTLSTAPALPTRAGPLQVGRRDPHPRSGGGEPPKAVEGARRAPLPDVYAHRGKSRHAGWVLA